MVEPGPQHSDDRTISRIVLTIVALIFVVVPLKIVQYGFMPVLDDPMADAAKAISGRPWTDMLVLKSYFALDPHVGWHTVLRIAHLALHLGPRALVIVAVVAMFATFAWSALPWFKRPEAWLAAFVLVAAVVTGLPERLTLGRPFLVSAAMLVSVLSLWYLERDSAPTRKTTALLSAFIGFAVLVHGSWYLWLLPIGAFVLAKQYRWARSLTIAWVVGSLVGAVLTGHPVGYLVESFRMGLDAFSRHSFERTLVSEFQPMHDSTPGLLLIGALLVFRKLGNFTTRPLRSNPAFLLACIGLALGYSSMRFWSDWGLIALMVVIAEDVQTFLIARVPEGSQNRLLLTLGLSAAMYLMFTNDVDSRWTSSRDTLYLSQANPELAGWLPDQGGVFYAAEMSLFYQTIFMNPNGNWKYMVGFEPAMMPNEDFAVYQNIVYNHGNPLAYMPWVRRMRTQDRVAIKWFDQPRLAGLEWKSVNGIWLGRLPQGAPAQ